MAGYYGGRNLEQRVSDWLNIHTLEIGVDKDIHINPFSIFTCGYYAPPLEPIYKGARISIDQTTFVKDHFGTSIPGEDCQFTLPHEIKHFLDYANDPSKTNKLRGIYTVENAIASLVMIFSNRDEKYKSLLSKVLPFLRFFQFKLMFSLINSATGIDGHNATYSDESLSQLLANPIINHPYRQMFKLTPVS